MCSFKKLLAVVLAVILAGSGQAFSQQQDVIDPIALFDEKKVWYRGSGEPWFNFFGIPESEIRKSIEMWERIGRELAKTSDSDKSGAYGSGGPTHGSFLRWSEAEGFIWLDVDHCMGGPMRILRGRVQVVREGITLIPEIRLGESHSHGSHGSHTTLPERVSLVSVAWRNSAFLVRKEELKDFADFAAGLGNYNSSYLLDDYPFLVTSPYPEIPVAAADPPTYPAGFEKYAKRSVRGSVVSIGKSTRRVNSDSDLWDDLATTLRVALEHPANLKVGLKMRAVGVDEGFSDIFEIKSFSGKIALIEHVRSISKKDCVATSDADCKDFDYIKVRQGLVLSSNGY